MPSATWSTCQIRFQNSLDQRYLYFLRCYFTMSGWTPPNDRKYLWIWKPMPSGWLTVTCLRVRIRRMDCITMLCLWIVCLAPKSHRKQRSTMIHNDGPDLNPHPVMKFSVPIMDDEIGKRSIAPPLSPSIPALSHCNWQPVIYLLFYGQIHS
jgi:hypothetical protein